MYGDLLNTIGFVSAADPELGAAMELELKRQRRNLELIASENIVSPAVMAAMGTVLTNKYAEGYPAHRYYGGCEDVDIVENIVRSAWICGESLREWGMRIVTVVPVRIADSIWNVKRSS